jgi:ribosomal protein S18 acetylase RimI-like enzyme
MNIQKVSAEDIDNIVNIHISAFPNSFTTKLGYNFLKKYYSFFVNQTESTILCARKNHTQIVGFICGTKETKKFYKQLLKRMPVLLPSLMMAVFKEKNIINKIIVKSFLILIKKQLNPISNQHNTGEIYSLAINKENIRKGIGSALLNEYIKQERCSSELEGVFITTDNTDSNKSVIDFYKKNNFKHVADFIQYPNRKMSVYTYYFTA